ncbi:hypothetical protein EDC45_0361 [Mesocricetibacter intestinalis]|uniref:Uncharacterized protein n=1 Tax=Mesocricetibacter intestinalis TaxID=1521930 RepID=A0A4V3DA07_9PAST|nr:hypothetical protein [Mesocricetibacter intestinalis]TDQ59703.1 hypothetical protein EDC45_0361 [Mesocricetibacter intestinalis]
MKDYKKLFSALCLSACLAACSGGGGGNNTPQNPPRGNQPPQQTPPQGQQPQQPQQPDKGKNPQPQSPESGKKPEQPKLPDSGVNPQQPPKVEAPQPEAKAYFTETVNKDGKNKDMRWNSAKINKNTLPVYNIDFPDAANRKLFKEAVIVGVPSYGIITGKGIHGEIGVYKFDLLASEGFYGYYSDLDKNNNEIINFAYGFNPELENKNIAENISSIYSKKDGFLYKAKKKKSPSDTSRDFGYSRGDVNIEFKNGKITKGEITSTDGLLNLFKIENGESINHLVITPEKDSFITNTDKGIANVHYLNSTKDANDNKYLVGTVDAKGWYGLLTAEKQ